MRTAFIIPARGGSKGIPNKNLRLLNGFSLLHWAINSVKGQYTDLFVSTEDPLIAATASHLGAAVIDRPRQLARDDTPMLEVMLHAARELEDYSFDTFAIVQPTQPLRSPLHIDAALRLFAAEEPDSVVSVVEIPAHYNQGYACSLNHKGDLVPQFGLVDVDPTMDDAWPKRRQDVKPTYSRDGTIYLTRASTLLSGSLYGKRCIPLIIPSGESANIDTEEDWVRAEDILRRRRNLT